MCSDLQRRLCEIDVRFSEQAHELNAMKERLFEAEAKQHEGVACSQKLEEQHKELLQHQRKILRHKSKVYDCTCTCDTECTSTVEQKCKKKTMNCPESISSTLRVWCSTN